MPSSIRGTGFDSWPRHSHLWRAFTLSKWRSGVLLCKEWRVSASQMNLPSLTAFSVAGCDKFYLLQLIKWISICRLLQMRVKALVLLMLLVALSPKSRVRGAPLTPTTQGDVDYILRSNRRAFDYVTCIVGMRSACGALGTHLVGEYKTFYHINQFSIAFHL